MSNLVCLLCLEVHKIYIHAVVYRKTPIPDGLLCLRLYCPVSHCAHKLDNSIPYTITVLPDFCIPYGRHSSENITTAIGFKIENPKICDIGLRLGVNVDDRVINKYADRFVDRQQKWQETLSNYLTETLCSNWSVNLFPSEYSSTITAWRHIKNLVFQIADRIEKLPNRERPAQPFGYALAVIGLRKKSLGP